MSKTKIIYICSSCGVSHPAWSGQCISCGQWNTLVESIPKQGAPGIAQRTAGQFNHQAPQPLVDYSTSGLERTTTYSPEINRVLGGGWTPGSVNLVAGQPGIGKSTLVLQLLLAMKTPTLYVSGEESALQVRDRAQRLGEPSDQLLFFGGTELEQLLKYCQDTAPSLLVIDSIQTIYAQTVDGAAGGVVQIRTCAQMLIHYAKTTNTPVILIGHITKDGSIGGPKLLEHMVDVVLLFEGDPLHHYRILRCQKNRFGSTHEIGIFEMKSDGLHYVEDPSSLTTSQDLSLPGNALSIVNQGLRSFIIQAQALVSPTHYGHPQRSPNGFDLRRMQMLLAVLERRGGINFSNHDVFINIAGSLKTQDTGLDMAVAAACVSTFLDKTLPSGHIYCGEIGLSGEIRPVKSMDHRIQEAKHRGMSHIYTAPLTLPKQDLPSGIKIVQLDYVTDLIQHINHA